MNVSEYRKQMEDKIEAARQRREQAGVDSAALDAVGVLQGAEGMNYKALAADTAQPEEQRCAALSRAAVEERDKPETVELVLDTLRDKTAPLNLRQTAMKNLKLLQFISPVSADYKGKIVETLRELLDDPDDTLRVEALELLAKKRDSRTQELMLNSLRSKDERLAPLAKIIQLLGYDIHTGVYPLLREIVSTPDRPKAAREAVRLLSSDPESAELLTKVFSSLEFPEEVRAVSASALQAVDPKRFEAVAKEVIGDAAQSVNMRTVSALALEKLSNPAALVHDAEFRKTVDRVIESKPEEKLHDALQSLKNRFHGRK